MQHESPFTPLIALLTLIRLALELWREHKRPRRPRRRPLRPRAAGRRLLTA